MPTEIYVDFFAGCLGGVAGVLAGHPLDTVKVRLQTQALHAPIYKGTYHCFMRIVRNEGPGSLYKGISSPLASLSMINALIFGVHGQMIKRFENPNSVYAHFVAGCCAGSAQAFISSPMELIKLRAQLGTENATTSTTNKPLSPFAIGRQILHDRGIRHFRRLRHLAQLRTLLVGALWHFVFAAKLGIGILCGRFGRGFLATQLRDCPAMGVYFASYQFFMQNLHKIGDQTEVQPSWHLLCAGGLAGLCSWLCNYPTDVVKTRFQADDNYSSYADVIRKTYMEGGWKAFFVGLGSTLIRAFPTNAATFFAVEWTYRIIFKLINTKQNSEQQKAIIESQNSIARQQRQVADCPATKLRTASATTSHWLLLPAEAGSTLQEPMII